jgi:hypothetical protein
MPKTKKQKIRMITTGEILEKPEAWVNHFARKIGVEFDLYIPDKKKMDIKKK